MATKLGLYNGALRHIKQRRLSSLTDAVESRRTLDDVYDGSIAYLLSEGLWHFASTTVSIEPDPDVEPEFTYSYAFAKPDDYVRLMTISGVEAMYPTLDDFEETQDYWLANVNPLFVTYVSDDTSFGNDLSKWPPAFERAMELDLATRIAPLLSALPADEVNNLEKRARIALSNARSKDAVNQPVKRPPPGRLVRARARTLWNQQRRQNS